MIEWNAQDFPAILFGDFGGMAGMYDQTMIGSSSKQPQI